jgi:hypothetical protein
MQKKTNLKTLPKWATNLLFIIGAISTISFRALIVINRFSELWGRIIWYTAVIGYIFFFLYRYQISKKRRRVIIENNLINKLNTNSLSKENIKQLTYIVNSLTRSKEMINYVLIFLMSILAIAADIILTIYY